MAFTVGGGTSEGTIGPPTDNDDGTYDAVFVATKTGTPLTVGAMKHIINEALKDPQHRDLDVCQAMVDKAFASDDYKEGRNAFNEKRKADFKDR